MADADPEQLTPGTVLSHFVLDEFIGGGAMGQVWRGSDRRDSSRVAVKIMNPAFGRDPMFRQRFEREAHLATLLKSPYTVQTLAFGRERGHYFIVMEFVEGDSIETLLERGPIPLDEALEIGSDVARALEAAATQKIVHRDLKPSNVILSPDGAAKLVDFGIASQTASRDSQGGFVGTVQYAAPEQQKGEADGRTDIYALGATLFHMLAGRPPYTGRTNSDILAQHAHSPFPAALLALQPEPVVDIVRRSMQKDPDDRYQTASELANALDRVRSRLAQQQIEAPNAVPGPGRTLVPEAEDPHERLGSAAGAAAAGGATLHLGQKPAGATAGPMDELSGGTVVFPSTAAPGTGTATGAPAALSPTVPPAAVPTAVGAGLGATLPPPPAAPPVPAGAAPPPSRPIETATVAAPMPYPGERKEEKGSRKGLLLAILGAVVLVGAIGGVAVALVGGGGGGGGSQGGADASATARASASASASSGAGGGSVTASPSASPSPSESASPSETATETATEAPTDTPAPTEVPATPTPVRPTQPPTQPPPTEPPAQPQLFFGGASCNGGEINASASFQNMPAGTQFQGVLDGAFTATSFGGGSGSVGFNWGGVPPGPHSITVSAAGKSTGGSVTC